MTATLEELARYRIAVLDNPPPKGLSVTGILSYLHTIAVLAGGIKDADVPRTMPEVLPTLQRIDAPWLPYKDSPDESSDVEQR